MSGKEWLTAAAVAAGVLLAYHLLNKRAGAIQAANAGVDAMTATVEQSYQQPRLGAPPIWALQSGTGEPEWALTPHSTPKDYLYTFEVAQNTPDASGSILVPWTNPFYRFLSGFDRPAVGFQRVNPPWPPASGPPLGPDVQVS